MRLRVRHVSVYDYDPPAERVSMRLKLFPSRFVGQATIDWRVSVNGKEVPPLLTSGFGDQQALWTNHYRTSSVEIVAEGEVETEDKAGLVTGLTASPPVGIFLRETPLTQVDAAIGKLAAAVKREDPLEELHMLSRLVHSEVAYRSGATNAATTAAEALALKAGVCQDHAHIFVAAARAGGHPARYVAGYMKGDGSTGELYETHAWAEAYAPRLGWVGFDPSNGVCPTAGYIRLSCGLDARGAAPIRGNILGVTGEFLHASVVIEQAQQ